MELAANLATLPEIIALLNSSAAFPIVAEAVLRAACQQTGASDASLLGNETDTTPLLRASYKQSNDATGPITPFQVPLRSNGRLVGLLELRGLTIPITDEQRKQLELYANLAAMLIQREYIADGEATLSSKIRQFELHKEEYIHLVSHQLRTPLTSIKGFAQLLGRQQKAGNLDAVGRYSDTILNESTRLNKMVNNLMELSRMEVAMVSIRAFPFSLNSTVQQAVNEANLDGQISTDYTPSLPATCGDHGVLKQALDVLLAHLSRTPNQHITIHTATDAKHAILTLTITIDDWAERSSDDLQTITLAQAVDSSDRNNPSMSLYVVRNLIQAMGGSFTLERSQQEGSNSNLRYAITLPLVVGNLDT